MPQRSPIAVTLVLVGLSLLVLGGLAWFGALSWFGRLPGDIRVDRPGFRLYAPITSMILISLVLTAAAAVIRRFWP
jgi:hypothetical protein